MTNEGEDPEKYFLAPVGRQSAPLVRGGRSAPFRVTNIVLKAHHHRPGLSHSDRRDDRFRNFQDCRSVRSPAPAPP